MKWTTFTLHAKCDNNIDKECLVNTIKNNNDVITTSIKMTEKGILHISGRAKQSIKYSIGSVLRAFSDLFQMDIEVYADKNSGETEHNRYQNGKVNEYKHDNTIIETEWIFEF